MDNTTAAEEDQGNHLDPPTGRIPFLHPRLFLDVHIFWARSAKKAAKLVQLDNFGLLNGIGLGGGAIQVVIGQWGAVGGGFARNIGDNSVCA